MDRVKDSISQSPILQCSIFDSYYVRPQTLKSYRFFALFAMTIICFFTFRNLYEFRHLTGWGEVVVEIYFIFISLCYFIYKDDKTPSSQSPFALWKMAHLFGVLAFTLQIFIPLLYWGWVISTNALKNREEILLTITTHAITASIIWVDSAFNKLEYYPSHAVFLFVFCTVYTTANYIVSKAVGIPVYKALNWEGIDSIFKVLLGYLIIYLGFGLGWYLAKRKAQKIQIDESDSKYLNVENMEQI